jgi:hypothetical protein
VKSYLDITENGADAFIDLWITAVSRNVDSHTGRQFGRVAALEERFYTPVWSNHDDAWFVDIDDVQDATGLTVVDEDAAAVDAADYVLLPRNAVALGRPYERLKLSAWTGEVAVEALWGWTAVPSAVVAALLLQAARLNARRDSPFGIAGSPAAGTEVRLLAQLDPDFRTVLRPLVRHWWAA